MTALNGGSTGAVVRWAVTEIDPALCPQLHHACITNEQFIAGEVRREKKTHRVTLFGSPPNLEM